MRIARESSATGTLVARCPWLVRTCLMLRWQAAGPSHDRLVQLTGASDET